ncbi:MAG: FAD:protein FMN transferase [Terriglobia bacterium]
MNPRPPGPARLLGGALAVLLGSGAASGVLGQRVAGEERPPLVRRAHYVMGTLFEIKAYGADREATAAALEQAFAAIRHVDEVMSHYRPESDLMRLNRQRALDAVPVPADLYAVLREAIRYGELSGGALDVTVRPLILLWEEAGERGRLPDEQELAERRSRVGFRHLELLEGSRVRLARAGVEVELGAIGKGWAVDRAVEILRAHGIENAFLSAGTSTVFGLGGGPAGDGWVVEVLDPCDPARTLGTVRLRDASLSTSASYERYWEIEGRRYGHIIDPRTGWSVEPLAGVTVVAPTATESDALATAVYVLGREEGAALLARLERRGLLVERTPEGVCLAQEAGRSQGRLLSSP